MYKKYFRYDLDIPPIYTPSFGLIYIYLYYFHKKFLSQKTK